MTDIHSHILPYTDDGATSFEESLSMIQMEYDQGIRNIFCTPHADYCNNDTLSIFRELQTRNYLNINIFLGSEILCYSENIDSIIESLINGKFYTMNNTKYILIEFDPYDTEENIYYCCTMLISKSYIPIIAHIERYYNLRDYQKFKSIGCLFQINMYSLAKERELLIKNAAKELIKHRYVSFIGSDAHRLTHRSPEMKSGIDYLYGVVDEKYIDAIVNENAASCLYLERRSNGNENYVV